jgi:hypothetical protein
MYDIYSNPINIIQRQINTYGSEVTFQRYEMNDYGEIDYTVDPVEFSTKGVFHAGTGKMGSATAIRFAYTSDAGLGMGQADNGILLLYDEEKLPQTGDICLLRGSKFYVRIVTDILNAHKILDVSLEIVGVITP